MPREGSVKPRPGGRGFNADIREREYLTPKEVSALMKAAQSKGRHRHRDYTMVLMSFRHGLRPAELVALRWDRIDFANGVIRIKRLKNGIPSIQPLSGDEIRALRRLQREYPNSCHVFQTERKGPITTSTYRKIITRAGVLAGLPFSVHPHMLRHACGFYLANQGLDIRMIQLYLGHVKLDSTADYTKLDDHNQEKFDASLDFRSCWQDT